MINPLVQEDVIKLSPSMKGGIAPTLEMHLRILATEILQKAGRSLRLPQPTIATSQVLIQRFYFEGSMTAFSLRDIILGSLFLACKLSESPRRTRDIINAVHYMILSHKHHKNPGYLESFSTEYSDLEKNMYRAEMYILKCLGFHIHVIHPYMWALNYLRVLGFTDHPIVQSTWNFINDSYRTVAHCMYQPNVIATACIFLASCAQQVILPNPWYLLFDVHAKDMFQVASQIEALYTIRLRWDLPFSTSELGSWITPHLEAKLSLEGYYESLELLEKQKEILPVHTTVSETAANKVITEVSGQEYPESSTSSSNNTFSMRSRSKSSHSQSSSHSKKSSYSDRKSSTSSSSSSSSSSKNRYRRHSKSRKESYSKDRSRSYRSRAESSYYETDRRRDSSRSRRRSSDGHYSSRIEGSRYRPSRR